MAAPQVEVEPEILFYAFRYALGRQTYAASDVAAALAANAPGLGNAVAGETVAALIAHAQDMPRTLAEIIVSEIDAAIVGRRAGAQVDEDAWHRARIALGEVIGR